MKPLTMTEDDEVLYRQEAERIRRQSNAGEWMSQTNTAECLIKEIDALRALFVNLDALLIKEEQPELVLTAPRNTIQESIDLRAQSRNDNARGRHILMFRDGTFAFAEKTIPLTFSHSAILIIWVPEDGVPTFKKDVRKEPDPRIIQTDLPRCPGIVVRNDGTLDMTRVPSSPVKSATEIK